MGCNRCAFGPIGIGFWSVTTPFELPREWGADFLHIRKLPLINNLLQRGLEIGHAAETE